MPAAEPSRVASPAAQPLPRAVIALGWVSLLTDAASDMIYPLIPAFLLALGGGAVTLGWLEGVAEAVGAVLKLVSGAAADRVASRKRLVALGYGVSAITRPLLALASQPFHAVLVRAVNRVGKGLRGPPRDAILASAVSPERRGHAFGFHRMMDNLGAVVGGLLAFVLLRFFTVPLRTVFAAAIVPGLLAVLVILVFVRETTQLGPRWRRLRATTQLAQRWRTAAPRRRASPRLATKSHTRESRRGSAPLRRTTAREDASLGRSGARRTARRRISLRFAARLRETTRSRSSLAHGCARRRISLRHRARLRETTRSLSPGWCTAARADASLSALAHGYARTLPSPASPVGAPPIPPTHDALPTTARRNRPVNAPFATRRLSHRR